MQKFSAVAGAKGKLPEKKGSNRTIIFAIPTHSGQVSVPTLVSIFKASHVANQMGCVVHLATRTTDALIERARNVMFSEFVRSGADDLIFVDADIGWDATLFPRFLTHPVDLVGGAYPVRGDPEMFVVRTLDNELSRNAEHGLMQVEAAGTGFLRITRGCALKMIEAYGSEYYEDDPTYDGRIYNIFECQIIDRKLYSEDYVFCRRWNAIGGQTWIDPEQVLTHTGNKDFTGCLMRYLEKHHEELKIPAHVPLGQGHLRHEPRSAVDTARALLESAA